MSENIHTVAGTSSTSAVPEVSPVDTAPHFLSVRRWSDPWETFMPSRDIKDPVLVLEFTLLGLLDLTWGSSYLLAKIALTAFPPITLIAIRVGIAAILLTGIVLVRGSRFPRDLPTWNRMMIQAFLNSIGAWTILAWGQQFIDSGVAGVLNSTSPIFVFFITLFWTRHEATNPKKLFGALLGICGVALIVGVDALRGFGQEFIAQLAVLLSALLFGCAAIYGKKHSHIPPDVTAAGTMICASLVLVPLSLAIDAPWTLTPDFNSVLAALGLGVFCTAGALLLYFRLLRTIGSMGVASQSYLRAAVSMALGAVILGESIGWSNGLGAAIAILGVAAINLPSRKPAP